MLQEIEQKVTSLLDSRPPQDQVIQGHPASARSDQESPERLASKLELLKSNLVSFQHLLEERQGEKVIPAPQPQDRVNCTFNHIYPTLDMFQLCVIKRQDILLKEAHCGH